VLRDVLIVGLPIALLGAAGILVGLDTLAGGITVNLGYVLAIIAGGIILGRQGSSWRQLGLAKPASLWKTALLGTAAWVGALTAFMAMQAIAFVILSKVGVAMPEIDQSRFNPLEGNLPLFILMVILAWTTIAFGEELLYRAFLLSRLIDHAGIGKGLAILIGGSIFGAVHFAEGPVGILSNGAFGILFGWIYVRSSRNLWITIIGHGLINTMRFAIIYAGAM
jgi:membrane protease YdiL (CAAX protease family)